MKPALDRVRTVKREAADAEATQAIPVATQETRPLEPARKPVPPKPVLDDRPSALRRYGAAAGVVLVLIAALGGVATLVMNQDAAPQPKRVKELIVNVLPPPPPPPPPPPQPEQKQPEPQMEEQPKLAEPEIKEEKPVDQPKDAPPDKAMDEPPPGPLGLDAAAEGPGDAFGLAGKPGGRGLGLGGGGGGGGSKWGWYASMVQQQIEGALRRNARTRNAVMQVQIRLWADQTGRVTRIQLASSTGDAEIDAALRNDVFPGLTLREPPPRDMPMPLVTRVTARRPT